MDDPISETPYWRRGFTLPELLVVVAILVILVTLLLSSIGRAREMAKDVACAENLRQLCMATSAYHAVNGAYPLPCLDTNYAPAFFPSWVHSRLLNDLRPHLQLSRPRLDGSSTAIDFPEVARCPFQPDSGELIGPSNWGPGTPSPLWISGYSYVAGLDELRDPQSGTAVQGVLIQPTRSAGKHGKRAVLWADTVLTFTGSGPPVPQWEYFHRRGEFIRTSPTPTALRWQNIGYSDGSVERGDASGTTIGVPNRDVTASYKVSKLGFYYWF